MQDTISNEEGGKTPIGTSYILIKSEVVNSTDVSENNSSSRMLIMFIKVLFGLENVIEGNLFSLQFQNRTSNINSVK